MSEQLKVAVVHYHLKRGGVTRVIESTADAFRAHRNDIRLGVVTGEPAAHDALSTVELPELSYADAPASIDPADLVRKLEDCARQCLGGAPDLWHIHNHSLGKNAAFTSAVSRIASEGAPVLFHLHDFAEDNRADNYQQLITHPELPERLYPTGPAIAYAVLNGRDHQCLLSAGMPAESLHLLPNAISSPSDLPPRAPFQDWDPAFRHFENLILYPVRATRRKNFGELLLWALAARQGRAPDGLGRPLFLNTLGTTNSAFQDTFHHWQRWADERRLPVRLAYGETSGRSYGEILSASDAFITTSVAEGFGLGFLEPWMLDRPLIGRNLPEITADFRQHQIQLDALYPRLEVPLAWVGGRSALRESVEPAMTSAYSGYHRRLQPEDVDAALDSMIHDNRVDFGRLDERLQEGILVRLDKEDSFSEIFPQTPGRPAAPAKISENAARIREAYSPEIYADRLGAIYRDLAAKGGASGNTGFLDPEAVLQAFLKPETFNLLRSA